MQANACMSSGRLRPSVAQALLHAPSRGPHRRRSDRIRSCRRARAVLLTSSDGLPWLRPVQHAEVRRALCVATTRLTVAAVRADALRGWRKRRRTKRRAALLGRATRIPATASATRPRNVRADRRLRVIERGAAQALAVELVIARGPQLTADAGASAIGERTAVAALAIGRLRARISQRAGNARRISLPVDSASGEARFPAQAHDVKAAIGSPRPEMSR
jgi:hypothetical protein